MGFMNIPGRDRGAYGTFRITAEVVNVCDGFAGSGGSYGFTLVSCDGTSHDG